MKWGTNSSEFLLKAVDSNFEWGHTPSAVYVFKWCVHLLHCNNLQSEQCYEHLNSPQFLELNHFLDMNTIDSEQMNVMIQVYEAAIKACE